MSGVVTAITLGFQTRNEAAAVGALMVYGIWRSRDQKRFKVTPDVWGRVERAVKSAAKRARDLNDFVESLKPKLQCSTINPRWMDTGLADTVTFRVDRQTGEIIGAGAGDRRTFWVDVLDNADHRAALDALYRKTAYVVALVRDRIEREKPIEAQFSIEEDAQND